MNGNMIDNDLLLLRQEENERAAAREYKAIKNREGNNLQERRDMKKTRVFNHDR